MAKAKIHMNGKDVTARWMMGFAAVLVLGCIVPVVPWRVAAATPVFHARFSVQRRSSLIFMTDKNLAWQPVTKWKREMCMLMKSYNAPDLLTNLVGAATTVVAQKTGYSAATAMGCKLWGACKDHVSARCMAYQTLMYVGFGVTACLIFSAVASMAVPCLVASDVSIKPSGKKKKEKKQAAEFNTMVAAITAFTLNFSGLLTFIFVTGSIFDTLKGSSYTPFPGASVGMFIDGFACFLQFVGMVICVLRCYGAKPEDSQEEEGDPQMMMGQPMMGQPMRSGPPGMGQRAF